ncbi:MAG TPA: hypothetical protein VF649_00790 [Sphingomonas sp.]|jgi:hypothetical protein|uniref:hypothetical protein n=1 Tax=Sphingomonas sp. TaxID=28214 RepID=UPI002EDAF984
MTQVERIVRERQRAAIGRVAAVAAAVLPDLTIETRADGVVLVGRGVSRRMLADARLRTIGVAVRAGVA